MPGRRLRVTTALVLLVGTGAFTLAGCESIRRETGLSKEAQTGAVGGAAFGGIVAAIAGANPAWIAASTILGGVTGGLIGDYLGKQDAERHARNNLTALDTLGPGQTSSWRDPETGNHGSTTVHRVWQNARGDTCKSYTETVHTRAKTVSEQGTVCRVPGGGWRVQRG